MAPHTDQHAERHTTRHMTHATANSTIYGTAPYTANGATHVTQQTSLHTAYGTCKQPTIQHRKRPTAPKRMVHGAQHCAGHPPRTSPHSTLHLVHTRYRDRIRSDTARMMHARKHESTHLTPKYKSTEAQKAQKARMNAHTKAHTKARTRESTKARTKACTHKKHESTKVQKLVRKHA